MLSSSIILLQVICWCLSIYQYFLLTLNFNKKIPYLFIQFILNFSNLIPPSIIFHSYFFPIQQICIMSLTNDNVVFFCNTLYHLVTYIINCCVLRYNMKLLCYLMTINFIIINHRYEFTTVSKIDPEKLFSIFLLLIHEDKPINHPVDISFQVLSNLQ